VTRGLVVAATLAATLTGCWTSAQPPPVEPTSPEPPPPLVIARRSPLRRSPCEQTIDHLIDLLHDDLAKLRDFDDKLSSLRDAAISSCTEMHWSAELMHCFGDTVDNTALQQCQSLVTTEQTSDLMRRVTEVLSSSAP
jgi:hypothetical protein